MSLFILLVAILSLLLTPGEALAWGPATHLELGGRVLENLPLIVPAVKCFLERYPYDYLYGCMNADIAIGKNLVDETKHCHNWDAGFKVLKEAGNDSQKAFAFGYLSHLAADTVAHNSFVPSKLVYTFSARTTHHIYWELRFDSMADKNVWAMIEHITGSIDKGNDTLLKNITKDTPFSFAANKTIYRSIIFIHRMKQWQKMIDALSKRSKWIITGRERETFFQSALSAIMDFLSAGNNAGCLNADPRGKVKLSQAKALRRRLKTVKRENGPWQKLLKDALKEVDDYNSFNMLTY